MLVKFLALAALTSLCVPYVSAAIMSLYLLDEYGIPLTADPVGTDTSGHTTWRLGVGASSGTFTSTPTASFPSVTLVEGATDFHQIDVMGTRTQQYECALATSTASDGAVVASCAGQLVVGSITMSGSEPQVTLAPIAIQVADSSTSKPATPTKSSGARGLRLGLDCVTISAMALFSIASAMFIA